MVQITKSVTGELSSGRFLVLGSLRFIINYSKNLLMNGNVTLKVIEDIFII